MKINKYNLGMIGAGSISDLHCSAIRETGRGNLYGSFDINRNAIEKLKEQFPEIKVYDSLESMIDDENVDVFAIFTPPKTHYKIIKKLYNDTDKPIFCEKPLVINRDEFANILEMPNSDKRIFVGQSYRYFTQMMEAKRYFQETSDTLRYFEIKFRKHIHKVRPLGGWRSEYENYVIVDNGMHIFDLLTHLTGQKIKKAYCQADNISGVIKGFDTGIVNLELESGAKGVIILEHNNVISNTPYWGNHYYRFKDRTLSLDENGLIEYADNKEEVIQKNILSNPQVVEDWKGSFIKMWNTFFNNVKNRERMDICPDNVKNSLDGVLMSIESARSNKVVTRNKNGKN